MKINSANNSSTNKFSGAKKVGIDLGKVDSRSAQIDLATPKGA
jgi:hypothetical protein